MTKIILKTGPMRLPGRKREPDIDHATQILELLGRGKYTINANDDGQSLFSVTIMNFGDRPFVNQPPDTDHVIRIHTNYGSENAALYDIEIPNWVTKLDRLIRLAAPSNIYFSSNILLNNTQGDTDG